MRRPVKLANPAEVVERLIQVGRVRAAGRRREPTMSSEPTPAAARPSRWQRTIRVASYVIAGLSVLLTLIIWWGNSNTLPQCDSKRAKDTLSSVFKAQKLSPTRYDEIKTLAKSDDEVRCSASLPLSEGGALRVDYRFFWEESTAKIEYRITR
jgi:hypothetical protein